MMRLWDAIFERLPQKSALNFPLEFIKAIPVGADLSLVSPKFIIFVLEDCLVNADEKGKKAINKVIELWLRVVAGKKVSAAAKSAAKSAAWSAAESAVYGRYKNKLIKLLKEAPVK